MTVEPRSGEDLPRPLDEIRVLELGRPSVHNSVTEVAFTKARTFGFCGEATESR